MTPSEIFLDCQIEFSTGPFSWASLGRPIKKVYLADMTDPSSAVI